MATSRHDVTQQEADDVTTPKEAVPAHDVTECTTSSDVISTPDATLTEQTCTASGFSRMSGPNPGRKRPAGRAKGRPAKRRLAAASQQLQAPVPASLAQPTGDVQNPSADTFQAGALPADGAYTVRFPQEPQCEPVKTDKLVGASPSFDYDMYQYPEDQSESSTVPESGQILNQLPKRIQCAGKLLDIFEQFADHKPVCVWMSKTLAWDLNLPMTTGPPFLPGLLQAFVICVGRPPLLLTLCDKGDHWTEVETYCSDTARVLHWSLLDFCHLDFTVLPVSATRQDFIRETVSLEEEVKAKVAKARRYFKSPRNLTEDTFTVLRDATTALVGATFVPCLLKDTPRDEMWLLLMGKEWRSAVSRITELLGRKGQYKLTYSPAMSLSVEVVAALEAAKRISFTRKVKATCTTEEVQSCMRRLKHHLKDELDIPLQLDVVPVDPSEAFVCPHGADWSHIRMAARLPSLGSRSEGGTCLDLFTRISGPQEAAIQLEVTTDRQLRKQMLGMYELIEEGKLPELCGNPSLGYPAFLLDWLDFCTRQKKDEQCVIRAKDNKYSLPLLYWSLWSDSTHLTHWCLTKTMDHVADGDVLSESLLSAVLATMMTAARDDRVKVKVKQLIKKLTDMQSKHRSSDTVKLVLPYPEHCHTEEGKTRYAEMKTRLKSDSMCYLDDPSLPIPAMLLSVTVTEDAVSVELPSQLWYLALRLLADREVDETDDDGNTLLHLAADIGQLDAVQLAVKSGASLVVENNEGQTPCQLAQKRWTKPVETVKSNDSPILTLQAACRDGDAQAVKVALCQGVSVQHRDEQNENTPLHTACENGQTQIASLLILLGAEVDTRNKDGATPLHLACEFGHKETAELLLRRGSKVDTQDTAGVTPLHWACQRGDTATAGLLTEHGADVNAARNSDGSTPLHLACQSGHKDVAALLTERGAAIGNTTPLHFARSSGLMETAERGAEINAETAETGTGPRPLHLACLSEPASISHISSPDSFGGPQDVTVNSNVCDHHGTNVRKQHITNIIQACPTCNVSSAGEARENEDWPAADDLQSLDTQHVSREHFETAVDMLDREGRVVLCGPPKSGKSSLGYALLKHYQQEGFAVYYLRSLCCHLQLSLSKGGRSFVLIDGGLGVARLDIDQCNHCESLLFNARTLRNNRHCLLVLTAYPHVLRELNFLEEDSSRPLLPSTIRIDVTSRQQDPSPVFTPSADSYLPLLRCILSDPNTGRAMEALLAMSMLGIGHLELYPPEVEPTLQRLEVTNVPSFDVRRLARYLKGSILSDTSSGFPSRLLYDAAGLALGRFCSLAVLLQVCDATFLVQHVGTSGTSTESSILIGPAEEERLLLMQRMYELIVDGQLPELCQHPSLGSPAFLDDFRVFCTRHENVQRLVNAVDTEHRLPLLYWSAWSPSEHLTRWVVEHVTPEKFLSQSLLTAALALVLFTPADAEARSEAKCFLKSLIRLKLKTAAQGTLKLMLPLPRMFATEETRGRWAELKTRLQSHGVCYLDNPSLPIPSTLLSVTVTEDAVSVELPSQHWYLALRLLADTKVDEMDDNGNTLLHLAADAGQLQVIDVVVKSGASVTVTNGKEKIPYRRAQRRRKGKKNVSGFRDSSLSYGLLQACSEGDVERVKALLCQGASAQQGR